MDLCVGIDHPIAANGAEIKSGEIPGGRCAVLRVVGYTDNLEPAALYLIATGFRPAARKHAISRSIASD